MTLRKSRITPAIFSLLSIGLFSSAALAKSDILITKPYLSRRIDSVWRSVDPSTNPPKRGEYIRLGFFFEATDTIDDVERSHSVKNDNGKAYDFNVEFKGVTKRLGKHLTYVSFKVPGDAPDELSYQGEVKGKGAGKEKISFDFPVSGTPVAVAPDVLSAWIAPAEDSPRNTVWRGLRPGEIVRLAIQFYTERSYHEEGDQLDVRFDIDDIAYNSPVYSRCALDAGYHISYRYIMVPTTPMEDYSPLASWVTKFRGMIIPHSSPSHADSAEGMFYTDPTIEASIPDPVAPALYISKLPPVEFLDPKIKDHEKKWDLKSDSSLEVGDTFYAYIVWKEEEHEQMCDMVLGTQFEIPEFGQSKSWSKRWRLRTGYSYKKFQVPADTTLTEASFRGALNAIGGSQNVVYGEPVQFKIKARKSSKK